MRKIIVYIAKFMRSIDCVLWGRTTYDQVQGFGDGNGGGATAGFRSDVRMMGGQIHPNVLRWRCFATL